MLNTCPASSLDSRRGICRCRWSRRNLLVPHPPHHLEEIYFSFNLLRLSQGQNTGVGSLSPLPSHLSASPADCPEKIPVSVNLPLQGSHPDPCPSSLWPGPKQSSSQQSPCVHACVPTGFSTWQSACSSTRSGPSHHSS